MGRSRVVGRIAVPGRRAAGVATVLVLAGVPVTATAAVHGSGAHVAAIVNGVPKTATFGGLTEQGWPVALQLSKHGSRIAWAAIGLDLKCTSGGTFSESDGYTGVKVTKAGRFRRTYGPATQRQSDGTSIEISGRFSGRLNKKRTAAAGTWRLKAITRDAGGAVTDTCDSGTVRWAVLH